MNLRQVIGALLLMILAALAVFHIFQRQFSGIWVRVALDPENQTILTEYRDDLRNLSDLDPENSPVYRERFERVQARLEHYAVLEHNREELRERVQLVLSGLLAVILLSSGAVWVWQHRRTERRLSIIQGHLENLSAGRTDIRVGDLGRGPLGRIARMIELTSSVIARQRKRLQSLNNLSAWQEAARRHAHEIRTPLTAARMELNQLASYVHGEAPQLDQRVNGLKSSVEEELDRLKDFTHQFTSFAKIGKLKAVDVNPHQVLERFTGLFASAWDNLELVLTGEDRGLTAPMDKDMVRQVLVNLCNNASLAIGDRGGRIDFQVLAEDEQLIIEVADNGPGIPPEVGTRLFEPYTTSRKIGEGMGLGLAISRKIMLDHGGDLILHHTGPEGATFHLLFPTTSQEDSHGDHHGG
ncbi:MAG: HAMP domain-containing sensor histidine kinase [Acidobacteriota bacterium]|nr:HAMP domain-containing sensor histidine kinase [Acidobacteriota bacterium]